VIQTEEKKIQLLPNSKINKQFWKRKISMGKNLLIKITMGKPPNEMGNCQGGNNLLWVHDLWWFSWLEMSSCDFRDSKWVHVIFMIQNEFRWFVVSSHDSYDPRWVYTNPCDEVDSTD
jgi:hypothetical protein